MPSLTLPEAATFIRKGEVIATPTEAVYGLSADPRQLDAVQKALTLKQRDPAKGLILVAADVSQLMAWVDWTHCTPQQYAAILARWPGPVTWVVPAKSNVSPLIRGQFDTIAVRVTAHPIMRALCEACGHALISTSANVSGERPAKTIADIIQQFGSSLPILEGALGLSDQPTDIIDAMSGHQLR